MSVVSVSLGCCITVGGDRAVYIPRSVGHGNGDNQPVTKIGARKRNHSAKANAKKKPRPASPSI